MTQLPGYRVSSRAGGNSEWLTHLEQMYDPGTRAYLRALGIAPGWRCLEVGAGTGSVVRWLSEQVGPGGAVVATDIDTAPLRELTAGNVEIRLHDITTDPLEKSAFDLVHARLVLEHLPEPQAALAKLIDALAPGGWLLVEDLDWDAVHPATERGAQTYRRVSDAMRAVWSGGGSNPTFGLRLPGLLRDFGLQNIDSEGRSRLMWGGTPQAESYFAAVLRQFAPWYVTLGLLTQEEIVHGLAWARDPDCAGVTAMVIAAWGQRGPAQ